MLERLDLDRIFSLSRKHGFVWAELYFEATQQCQVQVQERLEESRLVSQSGLCFRAFDGKKVKLFSSNAAETKDIVDFIEGRTPAPAGHSDSFSIPSAGPDATKLKTAKVSQLARALWADGPSFDNPSLQYEDRTKFFEVADHRGTRASGKEEYAGVVGLWGIERDGRRLPFRVERFRASIDQLLAEIDRPEPLRATVQNSLDLANPWPAPTGLIPIHWSPRAFAKLGFLFLRGFEGDLFLKSHSFLTEFNSPLPFHFSIQDESPADHLSFDNEGSPRRPVVLFDQGRPRALACNNWIAEQLAVPSTGHCRRESYRSTPTVGFWNPKFYGHQTHANPLQTMKWGLSVHDTEILKFDPVTAQVQLRLNQVRLIHHGEEGEVVEPVELTIPLLTLLESFRLFSETSATVGIPLNKQGQRLLTEIAAPAAASDPIPVEGHAPLNHYW